MQRSWINSVYISDLLNKWEAENVVVDIDGEILWVRAFGRQEEGPILLTSWRYSDGLQSQAYRYF